jgi:hypothetical protein
LIVKIVVVVDIAVIVVALVVVVDIVVVVDVTNINININTNKLVRFDLKVNLLRGLTFGLFETICQKENDLTIFVFF